MEESPIQKAFREFALADPNNCDREWEACLALTRTSSSSSPTNSTSSLAPAATEASSATSVPARPQVPRDSAIAAIPTGAAASRAVLRTKDDPAPGARRIYELFVDSPATSAPSTTTDGDVSASCCLDSASASVLDATATPVTDLCSLTPTTCSTICLGADTSATSTPSSRVASSAPTTASTVIVSAASMCQAAGGLLQEVASERCSVNPNLVLGASAFSLMPAAYLVHDVDISKRSESMLPPWHPSWFVCFQDIIRCKEYLVVREMGSLLAPTMQAITCKQRKHGAAWLDFRDDKHQLKEIKVASLQLPWLSPVGLCVNLPTGNFVFRCNSSTLIAPGMRPVCVQLEQLTMAKLATMRYMIAPTATLHRHFPSGNLTVLNTAAPNCDLIQYLQCKGPQATAVPLILWISICLDNLRCSLGIAALAIPDWFRFNPWPPPELELLLSIAVCQRTILTTSMFVSVHPRPHPFCIDCEHLHWPCFQQAIFHPRFADAAVCSLVHAESEGWFQFCPAGKVSLYSYGTVQFQWEIAWPHTKMAYSYLALDCSIVICYLGIETGVLLNYHLARVQIQWENAVQAYTSSRVVRRYTSSSIFLATAVNEKAPDVDATSETAPTTAICLPGSTSGEDTMSMFLTLWSTPMPFNSLPVDPPSSTPARLDVLESFTWSPITCSTIRSGPNINTPPSLLAVVYVFSEVSAAIVPWPPPSWTRARQPLIHGHDLFQHVQQKQGREFLVKDSHRNCNANWLAGREDRYPSERIKMVELKPPWPPRYATGSIILLLPWDPGVPLSGIDTMFSTLVHGLAARVRSPSEFTCLQGDLLYELVSCSFVIELIKKGMEGLEAQQSCTSWGCVSLLQPKPPWSQLAPTNPPVELSDLRNVSKYLHISGNSFELHMTCFAACHLIQRSYLLMQWKTLGLFSCPVVPIILWLQFATQNSFDPSCDHIVTEGTTYLGCQLFEWQIPWYSGLCCATSSSSWLHMQPVGGHLNNHVAFLFSWEVTNTIDSVLAIKNVSGRSTLVLQYLEVGNSLAVTMLLLSNLQSEVWVLYLHVTYIVQCGHKLMTSEIARSEDDSLTCTKRVLISWDPGGLNSVLAPACIITQLQFLHRAWSPVLKCPANGSKSGQQFLSTTVSTEDYFEKSSAVLLPFSPRTVHSSLQLSWDPGIWAFPCFCGVFAQAVAKGEITVEALNYCYYHYIVVFLGQASPAMTTSSTLCKSTSTTSTTSDTPTTMNHVIEDPHEPWDPGGSTWHRLGVKPNFMEGGLSTTYLDGLACGPPPWAVACPGLIAEEAWKHIYQQSVHNRKGAGNGTDGLGRKARIG